MKILIKNNANHFPENFPASKFSLPFVHFSINLNFLSIFQEIVLRRKTRKNTKENYLLFSLRNFPAFLLASEITFSFIDFQFRVALLFSTHHTICFLYKNKVAGILYGTFSYTDFPHFFNAWKIVPFFSSGDKFNPQFFYNPCIYGKNYLKNWISIAALWRMKLYAFD
jgi:hypothetical protein